jgi:hypothetical protein
VKFEQELPVEDLPGSAMSGLSFCTKKEKMGKWLTAGDCIKRHKPHRLFFCRVVYKEVGVGEVGFSSRISDTGNRFFGSSRGIESLNMETLDSGPDRWNKVFGVAGLESWTFDTFSGLTGGVNNPSKASKLLESSSGMNSSEKDMVVVSWCCVFTGWTDTTTALRSRRKTPRHL